MYEVFECLRCRHIFDMTDEARKEYTTNGGSLIKCPVCGCVGVDGYDMSKLRSGCVSREDGQFIDCADCPYDQSPYDCREYRRISMNSQILTVHFKETIWSK